VQILCILVSSYCLYFSGSGPGATASTLRLSSLVQGLELLRILASAEDEVNVACFSPQPGSSIVYGTKEGRLRTIRLWTLPAASEAASRASALALSRRADAELVGAEAESAGAADSSDSEDLG
jgi:WD40 repeat protein